MKNLISKDTIERASLYPGQIIPIVSSGYSSVDKVLLDDDYLYLRKNKPSTIFDYLDIKGHRNWVSHWLGHSHKSVNNYNTTLIRDINNAISDFLIGNSSEIKITNSKNNKFSFVHKITELNNKNVVRKWFYDSVPSFSMLGKEGEKILVEAFTDFIKHNQSKILEFEKQKDVFSVISSIQEDQDFIETLVANGAILAENNLKIPNYKSWATINPGLGFYLDKETYSIKYIPNRYIPVQHVTNDLFQGYKIIQGKETLYASCNITDDFKKRVDNFIERKNKLLSTRKALYEIQINNLDSVHCNKYDFPALIIQNLIHHPKFIWQEAFEYINQINSGLEDKDNYYLSIEKYEFRIKVQEAKNLNPKQLCPISKYLYDNEKINIVKQTCDSLLRAVEQENLATVKIKQRTRPINSILLEIFQKSLKDLDNEHKLFLEHFVYDLIYFLNSSKSNSSFISFRNVSGDYIKNKAPYSERGNIEITIKHKEHIKKVFEDLKNLGLISSSIVPSNVKGRVSSVCNKSKETPFQLPKGYNIIHGMTGVSSEQEALNRLQQMLEQDGILSYKERRKRNIHNKSMSPIGDLASGIDWGIPATINDYPTYGNYIFFIIDKEALHRKYMFFSDKDFGGGKDRFSFYNNYAQLLGQENIFTPPTREQKENHIRNIRKMRFNEIWFKHSISWAEISHILVSRNNKLSISTKKILAENNATKHIKVLDFFVDSKATQANTPCQSMSLRRMLKTIQPVNNYNMSVVRQYEQNMNKKPLNTHTEKDSNIKSKIAFQQLLHDAKYYHNK